MRLIFTAIICLTATVCLPGLPAAPQQTDQKSVARQLLLEASQLIKDIPIEQQGSVAANIASLLVRAGDLSDALATAQLPKKIEARTLAKSSIAWQLADEGNFAQAIALAEHTGDSQARDQAYDTLAGLFAEKDDLKGALQIAYRIQKDPPLLVDALSRVASQRIQAGDHSGAREVLRDARKTAEEALKENAGWAVMLLQIARTQAENGDTSAAFATLDEFSEIAHEHEESEATSHLLEQLAGTQAQLGDIAGAEETMRQNQSGDNDFPLMYIGWEQAKHDLMAQAFESVGRIRSQGIKISALREIAMIRGTNGTLNDALEAINLISDPNRRAETIATLALEQAENDNPAANATLQAAWNSAREANADLPISVSGIVAVTRSLLHDFIGAQQIVQDISDPESRVWPLWNITSMLAHQGHKQEALAIAHDEVAAYPRAYSLLGTAQGILKRADDEARSVVKKQ